MSQGLGPQDVMDDKHEVGFSVVKFAGNFRQPQAYNNVQLELIGVCEASQCLNSL